MFTPYAFEGDEVAALTWMPLAFRRRLDLAGLHLSLSSWQALDLSVRRGWCEHATDVEALARFAEDVRARCLEAGVAVADEPCVPPSWNSPDAARAVWDRASALGAPVTRDLDRWNALSEDARYALWRLCDGARREARFVAAVRELTP